MTNQLGNEFFAIQLVENEKLYEPLSLIEILELNSAKSLAVLKGKGIDGQSVVSMNRYKKGLVYYVGTDCNDIEFYENIVGFIRSELKIKPLLELPQGLEVVSRVTENKEYVFVLNYTRIQQPFVLAEEMLEILSNKSVSGKFHLAPLDVAIFERNLVK
ncbi:MAG: hypothetical protein HC906_14590 [Bacteroidales bacterium]|nr:hypothetical protein [Bacteroidales bacterium]